MQKEHSGYKEAHVLGPETVMLLEDQGAGRRPRCAQGRGEKENRATKPGRQQMAGTGQGDRHAVSLSAAGTQGCRAGAALN